MNPYVKELPSTSMDVYRVLWAFEVTDPCLQHAIKKLLCAGQRGGGKTEAQDISEAIASLKRWQDMRREEQAAQSATQRIGFGEEGGGQ